MYQNPKNILITNDDGFEATGIKILKNIAKEFTDNVYVVSPKINQSAKSRSITIRNKIQFYKQSECEWVVNGTPTDCIIFALNHLMKMNKPDLILSGINAGSNVGDEVSYSGTVAAAWEGALRGINSIALSQFGGGDKDFSYICSKQNSFEIINYIINLKKESPIFFNVNFPLDLSKSFDKKSFLFTKLGSQKKADEVIVNHEKNYFEIGKMLYNNHYDPKSDLEVLKQDKISITPLTLDLTNNNIFNNFN